MRLGQGTRGTNLIAKETGTESFFTKMEDTTKASGKIIKWMVGANSITKEENSLTKAIGAKISSTDSEKSTMTTQCFFNAVLISLILTYLKITGSTMKECL
jgi:hypothetical protein